MPQTDDLDLTHDQRRALHAAANLPDLDSSELAELLDISPMLINDVQESHSNLYDQIRETEFTYAPSFGHPYSIILPERSASDFIVEEGDLLELLFSTDGSDARTLGKVKYSDGSILDPDSTELQARVIASYQAAECIQQSDYGPWLDLEVTNDGRADFGDNWDFLKIISKSHEILERVWESSDILVGVGILEILHGERNPGELASTPLFDLERDFIPEYLFNEGPELDDVSLYTGEVSEPDCVYFSHHGEMLDDVQKEALREVILDYGVFKSSWNYTLPNYTAVVGPTTTEGTAEVVRVTADALDLVPGVEQTVQFVDSNGDIFTRLTPDDVYSAIQEANPQFESLASQSRHSTESEDLPLRKDGDDIYFLFDQVTLVLSVDEWGITWTSPLGIDYIDVIKEAVNDMISKQLGMNNYFVDDVEGPRAQRVSQEDWVIDTNALYHDHVANQPTSILHTIFPQRFFYQSTIHIPWPVLFEFNKHPESGNASGAANEKGVQNAHTLRTLDTLGFLDVSVQDIPEEIPSDVSNGDIADIHILAYADVNDAHLISGDQSLCQIARISDTAAVNVGNLSNLKSPIDDQSSLETEIIPRVGDALHKKEDIAAEIEDRMNTDATIPDPDSSRLLQQEPEAILDSWCSQGSLLPYMRSSDDSVCYAQCKSVTVVATKSGLEVLSEYVGNEGYLDDKCLEQIAEDIRECESREFPELTLVVPSEYVIDNAQSETPPSEFNERLLVLNDAENLQYKSGAALRSKQLRSGNDLDLDLHEGSSTFLSMDDYLALCLARSEDIDHLLLPDDQPGLWKFTKLLDVAPVVISSP